MSDDNPRLLLLSSNVRRRYAEDILTALGLPPGSMLQFRYDADYVSPVLQRGVANQSIISTKAILAFIADAEQAKPFVVPVRFATVISATCEADIYIFRLRVGTYVDLSQYPSGSAEIAESKRIVDGIKIAAKGKYYPAVTAFPDMSIRESSDPASHWLAAARRLSKHETFSNAYFLRVDPPITQSGDSLTFQKEGRLAAVDQQSIRLQASFYSARYEPDVKPVLTCRTDGTFLRVSSDDTYDVAHRYDTVEFWLHPAALNFDTLSRVTMTIGSGSQDDRFVPAHARFPVIVRRSTSRLALRVAASASGALLVALPAVLGPAVALPLRIAAALAGAALLAISSVVLNTSR